MGHAVSPQIVLLSQTYIPNTGVLPLRGAPAPQFSATSGVCWGQRCSWGRRTTKPACARGPAPAGNSSPSVPERQHLLEAEGHTGQAGLPPSTALPQTLSCVRTTKTDSQSSTVTRRRVQSFPRHLDCERLEDRQCVCMCVYVSSLYPQAPACGSS